MIDHVINSPHRHTQETFHVLAQESGIPTQHIILYDRFIANDKGNLTWTTLSDFFLKNLLNNSTAENIDYLKTRK